MFGIVAKKASNPLVLKNKLVHVSKRNLNLGSYQLQTPIADKIIATSQGKDAIKASIREQINIHMDELAKNEQLYGDVPENLSTFQTMRNFLLTLNATFDYTPPRATEDDYKFLEVHGLSELINKYSEAFERLEVKPLNLKVPKEIEEMRELELLNLAHFEENKNAMVQMLKEDMERAQSFRANLASIKITDFLEEYPEIDEVLEQEIIDARWDLAFRSN